MEGGIEHASSDKTVKGSGYRVCKYRTMSRQPKAHDDDGNQETRDRWERKRRKHKAIKMQKIRRNA